MKNGLKHGKNRGHQQPRVVQRISLARQSCQAVDEKQLYFRDPQLAQRARSTSDRTWVEFSAVNSSLASVRFVAGGLLYDQWGCNSDSVKIALDLARNAFGSRVE